MPLSASLSRHRERGPPGWTTLNLDPSMDGRSLLASASGAKRPNGRCPPRVGLVCLSVRLGARSQLPRLALSSACWNATGGVLVPESAPLISCWYLTGATATCPPLQERAGRQGQTGSPPLP